jgi:hypothetical protein
VSCDGVLLEISFWVFDSKSNVRIRSEVKYEFRAMHALRQCGRIQNVASHQAKIGRFARRGQKPVLAGGKIVVPNHHVAVGQEPFGQGTADEPGATGYKASQLAFLYGDEGQISSNNRPQVVLCTRSIRLRRESIAAEAAAAKLPLQDLKAARF